MRTVLFQKAVCSDVLKEPGVLVTACMLMACQLCQEGTVPLQILRGYYPKYKTVQHPRIQMAKQTERFSNMLNPCAFLILFIICFNSQRKNVQGEKAAALFFSRAEQRASDHSPMCKEYLSVLQHGQDNANKVSWVSDSSLKFKSLYLNHLWREGSCAVKCVLGLHKSIYSVKPVLSGQYSKIAVLGLLLGQYSVIESTSAVQ